MWWPGRKRILSREETLVYAGREGSLRYHNPRSKHHTVRRSSHEVTLKSPVFKGGRTTLETGFLIGSLSVSRDSLDELAVLFGPTKRPVYTVMASGLEHGKSVIERTPRRLRRK